MKFIRTLLRWLKRLAATPPALFYLTARNREKVDGDLTRWCAQVYGNEYSPSLKTLVRLLSQYPEFRNLFYHRIPDARLVSLFCPPYDTLFLHCNDIGPGLFIQHGFATIVNAKSVGANCWINQQVTVGHAGKDRNPTIGNNVAIRSGAKILGLVTVGDNAIIGANAVVVKDVPPNCTVVGVPARIIKRDGVRVDEPL